MTGSWATFRRGQRWRRSPRRTARTGNKNRDRCVYDRSGMPCRRCSGRIQARGQGQDNRTTFWCPSCQH